jgi:hypothetical protein
MTDVLEIWEKDTVGDSGCGCIPVKMSMIQAQRIMDEIKSQNKTLEQIKTDFSGLKVVRDIVNLRRPRSGYPDHVREFVDIGANPPLFFYNTKLIHGGNFPDYEELKSIIDAAIKRP